MAVGTTVSLPRRGKSACIRAHISTYSKWRITISGRYQHLQGMVRWHEEVNVVWYAGAYAPAYHTTLCYEPIHGRTTSQPVLTTFPQPRHIPTRGYNITQSSVPDDGQMVARNMLSNQQKRNKEYDSDIQLVFLIHTELRCTVNHTPEERNIFKLTLFSENLQQ